MSRLHAATISGSDRNISLVGELVGMSVKKIKISKFSDFSALGLNRDLGFSRGHQGPQGHRPHDDDNDEEEDDEVEDNDKDDNNDKGISALGLDTDLGFSRGHQGHCC